MMKTRGKPYSLSCYCKSCKKEFEINLNEFVRRGEYCDSCAKNKEPVIPVKIHDDKDSY